MLDERWTITEYLRSSQMFPETTGLESYFTRLQFEKPPVVRDVILWVLLAKIALRCPVDIWNTTGRG